MKVLAIIESLGYGGAERLLVTLLPELKKGGVDCDVAVLGAPYSLADELEANGIRVFRIDSWHRWWLPRSAWRLFLLTREYRYDAFWGHLYFGNLHAALLHLIQRRAKVLLTLHSTGYTINPPKGIWYVLRMKLEQAWGKHAADSIVAVSKGTAQDYERALGWTNVQIIHNTVSIETLPVPLESKARERLRREIGIPADCLGLLMAGRFSPQKGHTVLIDALYLLSQEGWRPYCVAFGKGDRSSLERKIKRLGLEESIRLFGPRPHQELMRFLRASDIFVMPSIHEPFGIAALEAMALGVPSILSNVEGLPEVAGDEGAALMVSPGDPRGLAEALKKLRDDPGLMESLSRKGRARVQSKFDLPIAAAKWIDLFSLCAQ